MCDVCAFTCFLAPNILKGNLERIISREAYSVGAPLLNHFVRDPCFVVVTSGDVENVLRNGPQEPVHVW